MQQQAAQNQARFLQAVAPRGGITAILQDEFDKGVRTGMLMAVDLPRAFVTHFEGEIERIRAEMALENPGDDDDEDISSTEELH